MDFIDTYIQARKMIRVPVALGILLYGLGMTSEGRDFCYRVYNQFFSNDNVVKIHEMDWKRGVCEFVMIGVSPEEADKLSKGVTEVDVGDQKRLIYYSYDSRSFQYSIKMENTSSYTQVEDDVRNVAKISGIEVLSELD